jgi:hypothetical protein
VLKSVFSKVNGSNVKNSKKKKKIKLKLPTVQHRGFGKETVVNYTRRLLCSH